MRSPERLHDDGHHRVTRFTAPQGAAGPRRAVICFEPGREQMSGFDATACPRFADNLGIDALMVQTARRDWFISGRAALEQALEQATRPYAEVTATGFSMGGYGALLYSAAARVRRVLAVSPQYCIDPAIAPYDTERHDKFARIGLPMPCPEAHGNHDLRGVLLFDPMIATDRQHAARIGRAFPRLRLVALPYGGHPASSVIGEHGSVGQLSRMLVRARLDPLAIRAMHREARRGSARYQLNLAMAALPHHGNKAQKWLEDLAESAPRQIRLEAGIALLARDHDLAMAALSNLLSQTPDAPLSWARRISRAVAGQPQ